MLVVKREAEVQRLQLSLLQPFFEDYPFFLAYLVVPKHSNCIRIYFMFCDAPNCPLAGSSSDELAKKVKIILHKWFTTGDAHKEG